MPRPAGPVEAGSPPGPVPRTSVGLVRRLVIGLSVLLLLAAACGNDDDGADGAADGEGTTTTTAADGGEPTGDGATETSFASDDFADGAEIPVELTCDGENRSPELHWEGLLADTETVAVVVDDLDAPGGTFIHWVIWDVPADSSIESGSVPAGSIEGANDAGGTGWTGPCPPEGDGSHRYVFSLLAVPGTLDEAPGAPANEVRDGVADAGGGEVATFTGTYER